jgi:ribosome-binding protein aMBF1 (putative translation factor)
MTITGKQVREARQLLGWSQLKLAKKSKVTGGKIMSCESGQALLAPAAADAVRRALEGGGVEFASDIWPAVRLRKSK